MLIFIQFYTLITGTFSGFCVYEVAHDFVLQLKNWIISKGMLNLFDFWHGTWSFFFEIFELQRF